MAVAQQQGQEPGTDILQQGLKLPAPPQAATEPLPAPRTLLSRPPQYQQPEHTYIWPADTKGQVQPGRKRPREPRPVVSGPVAPSVPLPGGDQPSVPEVQETVEIQSTVTVSYSTEYKRKRREAEGKNKNQRHRAFNECRKCGLPKTNDMGHIFLGGFVYCRNEASPEQSRGRVAGYGYCQDVGTEGAEERSQMNVNCIWAIQ